MAIIFLVANSGTLISSDLNHFGWKAISLCRILPNWWRNNNSTSTSINPPECVEMCLKRKKNESESWKEKNKMLQNRARARFFSIQKSIHFTSLSLFFFLISTRRLLNSPHRKLLICPLAGDRWLHRVENLCGWIFWIPNLCLVRIDRLFVIPLPSSLHVSHSKLRIWTSPALRFCCMIREAGKVKGNPCFPHRDLSDSHADT